MRYGDLIDYFIQLAQSHRLINDVIVGDYEDIIGRERKGINYPALWIESPTATMLGDNDSLRQQWEGAIVVLVNSPRNPDTERFNLDLTFTILRQIAFRMSLYDQRDDIFLDMKIKDKRFEAIQTLGNDNDQGWRLSFVVDTQITDDCYDAAVWDETIQIEQSLRFSYQVDGADIIASASYLPDGYTFTWLIKTDSNDYVPIIGFDNDVTIPMTTPEATLLLRAVHNVSGHKRYASAHITSSSLPGRSVPYIYTKF